MRLSREDFSGPDFHQFDPSAPWAVSRFLVPDFGDVGGVVGVAGYAAAPGCEVVGDEGDG